MDMKIVIDAQSDVTLHTGNTMPVLGLGTWELTHDTAGTIEQAFTMGYRMIDTSGDYGTQPGIGEGIRRAGLARSDFYLVTKIEECDAAYEAVRRNLFELGLDFVDLVLIHRPPPSGAGEELWHGLMRARKEGFVRDIGVSNYSIKLIDALIEATGVVPVVNQIEWSPFGHSEAMLRYARDNNIIIQAYSPLTRGKRLNDPRLGEIACKYSKTLAQALIRWNLQRGTVPIPKANQRGHMEENINVFDFRLDENDMATLNGLNEAYSSLGSLSYE